MLKSATPVVAQMLPNIGFSNDFLLLLCCYLRTRNRGGEKAVRITSGLARHPRIARFATVVVVATSVCISLIFAAIVLVLQTPLSRAFTTDATVIKAVSSLTPLLAISIFLNGIQPILSGVAVGSGWQTLVAYVNLGTYYVIGLPIGCVLGFKTSLGAEVIWWGMIVGVSLQTITLIIWTCRTDWSKEVEKAIVRLSSSTGVEVALVAT